MFDIAWTEILIIAVIAVIVVGPKELPGMLRAFGKTFGQVRRTARDFQNTFNDALREAERQANLDEVKKDLDAVRNIDPTKDLRKTLDETKSSLTGKVTDKPAKPASTAKETTAQTDEGAAEASATTPAPPNEVVPLKSDTPPAAADPLPSEPADPAPSGDPVDPVDDAPKRVAAGADRR